jgi:hypothetical protein
MNSHPTRPARFLESVAIATLVLASMVAHGAVAQAQVSTGSSTPAAASQSPPQSPPVSASAQDIREIRGPKAIASPWLIPLVVLSVLLSGGGICAAWVWYRRRSGVFLQTPVEIALARLEYARGLMRPELGRDFSIEVSSIVREYMEGRFRVMAAHLTTHEFLTGLLSSQDPLLSANRPLLAEFMESCDLAKFGGWHLSIPDMEAMLQSARRFVVESAADSGRQDTVTPPASISANPTPTAAIKSPPVTPRGSYDSLPST